MSAIPTTPTKSTFLQWNQFSTFHFHLFRSFRNTIGQAHETNLRIPCSVKTPQYQVRKCVHESKPKATNGLRVNPITVQYEAGKWHISTVNNCMISGAATMRLKKPCPSRNKLSKIFTGEFCQFSTVRKTPVPNVVID